MELSAEQDRIRVAVEDFEGLLKVATIPQVASPLVAYGEAALVALSTLEHYGVDRRSAITLLQQLALEVGWPEGSGGS